MALHDRTLDLSTARPNDTPAVTVLREQWGEVRSDLDDLLADHADAIEAGKRAMALVHHEEQKLQGFERAIRILVDANSPQTAESEARS
ncbi:hypothetical protein [Herbiconiux sp. VKM Ac-2851]|uniref:hypothetical protein n=1 Tax=Herbiconiux sp. VKM Ac-2851 TaxID=2739025 RepID=UPI001566FF1D|nr:hypothetical protein [Herbiconiux sp. VKM Ac-2851]NQX36272.1 hypothetical protein [Herbiconiux sp. VKM Ac-2851]